MALVEDITQFFNVDEFAQVATWGALTSNVLVDSPTEDLLGGKALGVNYEITLPIVDFPNIARGAVVVLDGQNYTVREVRILADGATKKLSLSK